MQQQRVLFSGFLTMKPLYSGATDAGHWDEVTMARSENKYVS